MKSETENAIREIAKRAVENHKPHEVMQLAQAALSFGHVLAMLDQIERDK